MMDTDDGFSKGHRVIQKKLEELAAERGLSYESIDFRAREHRAGNPRVYVYRLEGTRKCISLRAREIRLAAEPAKMEKYIAPRLEAMFEDSWWRKSVVLMRRRKEE